MLISRPTALKFKTLVHCPKCYLPSKFQSDRIKIDQEIAHLHLHPPLSTILRFSHPILAQSVSNFTCELLTIQLIHCTKFVPIA